jgi:cardiolipin synthase A/B
MRQGRLDNRGLPARVLLALLEAGLSALVSGCAGAPRVLPENAIQPPGDARFDGYPEIGRRQRIRIAEEALRASADELIRMPLGSIAQVTGRTAERLAVRVREALPITLPPQLHPGRVRAFDLPCDGDLGGGAGGPPTPARLTLLPSSEAAIAALLDLIAHAQQSVDLMMYGWEDDPTGREVADALAARARAGVHVRLLVDRTAYLIHNAAAARGECTFLDALGSVPNVELIEPQDAFFRFDHRKLAVIDDRVAWSGSMILTDVARRRWRNFEFLAEGPIVAQYATVFAERWQNVGGDRRWQHPSNAAAIPIVPNATVRMVRTDDDIRTLKKAIYNAVDHARHHIYLENPYFSDQILTKKLVAAQARGVDVRAVLTLRGNVEQLNRFETLTANRLFRGGVRVFLYPTMTHVKAMSVDGVWAYVGTGNFDELSLRNNREVSLTISTPTMVAAIDQSLFLPDIAASGELTALLPQPSNRLLLEFLSVWY